MKPIVKWVIAMAGGIIITLFTGLVDVTPAGLMGARWFGFPMPWLYRMVVAPQYFPWRADYLGLIVDVVAWAAVVGVAVLLFWRTPQTTMTRTPPDSLAHQ